MYKSLGLRLGGLEVITKDVITLEFSLAVLILEYISLLSSSKSSKFYVYVTCVPLLFYWEFSSRSIATPFESIELLIITAADSGISIVLALSRC